MTLPARFVVGALLTVFGFAPFYALAQNGTLRISTTERLITTNPYGDSNSQMYSTWCQISGCLGIYDWKQKKYVRMLAQSWEIAGPAKLGVSTCGPTSSATTAAPARPPRTSSTPTSGSWPTRKAPRSRWSPMLPT